MRETITVELVRRYTHTPPSTEQDIYDTQSPRLALRIRPSGVHSYRVRLGRGKWFTLGGVDLFTPAKARKQAQSVLGDVADGEDPQAEKQKTRQRRTLADYIEQVYIPGCRRIAKPARASVRKSPRHSPRWRRCSSPTSRRGRWRSGAAIA